MRSTDIAASQIAHKPTVRTARYHARKFCMRRHF